MLHVSCSRLAQVLQGELRLSSMPPLGGRHEPVGAMRADAVQTRCGDVLWLADHRALAAQLSGLGAASGVVSPCWLPAWPGKFVIRVPCLLSAAQRLHEWSQCAFRGTRVVCKEAEHCSSWSIAARWLLQGLCLTQGPREASSGALDELLQECNARLLGGCWFTTRKNSDCGQEVIRSLLSPEAIAIITRPVSESRHGAQPWLLRYADRNERRCEIECANTSSHPRIRTATRCTGAADRATIDGLAVDLAGWSLADVAAAFAVAEFAGATRQQIVRRWSQFEITDVRRAA